MPITTALTTTIERVSILDEHGNFDEKLGKGLIPDADLLKLYETDLRAVDGVEQALEALGPQHFSVASNSPYERVDTALRLTGPSRFFGNRITTFEHVARGKPEPDVFIEAARRAEGAQVAGGAGGAGRVGKGCQPAGFAVPSVAKANTAPEPAFSPSPPQTRSAEPVQKAVAPDLGLGAPVDGRADHWSATGS